MGGPGHHHAAKGCARASQASRTAWARLGSSSCCGNSLGSRSPTFGLARIGVRSVRWRTQCPSFCVCVCVCRIDGLQISPTDTNTIWRARTSSVQTERNQLTTVGPRRRMSAHAHRQNVSPLATFESPCDFISPSGEPKTLAEIRTTSCIAARHAYPMRLHDPSIAAAPDTHPATSSKSAFPSSHRRSDARGGRRSSPG